MTREAEHFTENRLRKALLKVSSEQDTMKIDMNTITIDTEWGLSLIAHPGTNGKRFVTLFRQVWEAIPEQQRIKMRRRWRRKGQPIIILQVKPLFVFEGVRRYPLASYLIETEEFHFRSTWIDKMPDEMVKILIAHELAHCLIIASGGALDVEVWKDELEVAEVLETSGLSDFCLSRWIILNGHTFYCEDCFEEIFGPVNSIEQCRECLTYYLIEPEGDGWNPVRCNTDKVVAMISQHHAQVTGD